MFIATQKIFPIDFIQLELMQAKLYFESYGLGWYSCFSTV